MGGAHEKKKKKTRTGYSLSTTSLFSPSLSLFLSLSPKRADVWKLVKCLIKGYIRACGKQVRQPPAARMSRRCLT